MGIFGQKRFAVPFRSRVGQKTKGIGDHYRSDGERRILILSCLATILCVVAAIAFPNWATVHGGVILCGLTLMLYFAPWVEDRDGAPQLKFEQQEPEATIRQPAQEVDRRRTA